MSQLKMTCIWCQCPIYYSWGEKRYVHEGHRPSKVVVRNAAVVKLLKHYPGADPEKYSLPPTWAKWIPCEDADGTPMGKDATYWPNPNMEGAGI